MTDLSDQPAVRIIKKNSVDFVRKVFECYSQQRLFIIDVDGAASNADLVPGEKETYTPEDGAGWFNFDLQCPQTTTPAQIIFSSGTEGRPKAIAISHKSLANVVERLNTKMSLGSTVREYIGAPVTYSFGLGRCRAIASVGGHGYIPPNGFDLRELQTMIAAGEVNAISAVPSLWRLVFENDELFTDIGENIQWIEIGSQYMSASEKIRLKELFPNANIVQHYGLTEASRSTLLHISGCPEAVLESVGPADDSGVEIRLDQDQRIQIRGDHVALGRIVDGDLQPLAGDDGWLTTSDLGEIRDGFLFYKGRFDDIVNCGGIKVDPETLQQQVNQLQENQPPVAICGVADAQRGEAFFVAVEHEGFDKAHIRDLVHNQLLAHNINARDAIHVVQVKKIPRTETGKVQRKELAKLYVPAAKRIKASSGDSLLADFETVFSDQEVSLNDSFVDLGGDSLNFVKLSIDIEKRLGFLPENWEEKTIRALEQEQPHTNRFMSPIEISVLLRAIAISCIVLSHTGWKVVGGGTYLLFILIGANFARFQLKDFANGKAIDILPWYGAKLVIPYMFLAVAFSLTRDYFNPVLFLLIQNMWNVSWTIIFPFWFVQVLMQSLLILIVLFAIPAVRNGLKSNAWQTSYIIFLCFIAIRVLYPLVWDTAPMSNMVAPRFIAYIWLGWTLFLCDTNLRKFATIIPGVALAYFDNMIGIVTPNFFIWLSAGCILLPLLPKVWVPNPVKWAANYLAAATFYLFVFNGPVIYVMQEYVGVQSYIVNFALAVGISMLIWHLFEKQNILNNVLSPIRGYVDQWLGHFRRRWRS